MEDGIKHQGEESQPVKSCERGRQPFIVFVKSTKASTTCKGSFDHPSPGQQDEALFGLLKFNNDQVDSMLGRLLRRFFPGVTLVNKSYFHVLVGGFLYSFGQI